MREKGKVVGADNTRRTRRWNIYGASLARQCHKFTSFVDSGYCGRDSVFKVRLGAALSLSLSLFLFLLCLHLHHYSLSYSPLYSFLHFLLLGLTALVPRLLLGILSFVAFFSPSPHCIRFSLTDSLLFFFLIVVISLRNLPSLLPFFFFFFFPYFLLLFSPSRMYFHFYHLLWLVWKNERGEKERKRKRERERDNNKAEKTIIKEPNYQMQKKTNNNNRK